LVIIGDNRKRYIEIEVLVKVINPLAVMFDDGTWVPKSCMEDWPDEGEYGVVIIAENFAIDKGLI